MSRRLAMLVAGAVLTTAAPASAEPAVGVLAGAGNTVVTFDTATPGSFLTSRTVVGLAANERLIGIDYRYNPLVGTTKALYAVGATDNGATDDLRTYTLDPSTGLATLVGGPESFDHGANYGISLSPLSDRIRIVNDAEENGRINPNDGSRSDPSPTHDQDLSPAADVTAIASDRVDTDAATPTTLYGLSRSNGTLVVIGGLNGSPGPNNGNVTTVGSTGLGTFTSLAFDISPSGAAFAGSNTTFATVNLGTGAAPLVGALPSALRALAIVPAATMTLGPSQTRSEAAGPATFTVTRGGDTKYTVMVDYAASDGSAAGRLVFGPDETSKTFTAPVVNDTVDAPDRTVTYSLSRADGLTTLGAPATLTITDDDAATDATAPKATLKAPPSTTLKSLTSKGVKATITVSEAATLEVSLEGTPKSAVLSAAYGLTLATKTVKNATGTKSVTLKPSSKLVGKPRRAFKVRIKVVATDAAGNRSTATRTLTVKK
jgi:hypothetical protein